MLRATITADGGITLAQEVLDALALKPGDQVQFVIRSPDEVLLLRTHGIEELKGFLHRSDQRALTVEEMNDAIGEHVRQDWERISRRGLE